MKTKLESYLSEVANLDHNETGIKKLVIHVLNQGYKKQEPHAPRVKVSNVYGKFRKEDSFVINILTLKVEEGEVKIKKKEFEDLIKWIKLNKKLLIKFWKNEINYDVFIKNIKKI